MHRVSSAIAANMKIMIGRAVKRPILTAKNERMSEGGHWELELIEREPQGYDQIEFIYWKKRSIFERE